MVDQHVAVLLMAYGSPNSLEEVGEYLRQVREGRPTSEADVERLRERYRRVGGRTPLLKITTAQAVALQRRLKASNTPARVYIGMKHWHPFIEDTVRTIVNDGAARIVGLALAPHYSKLSIGGYENAVYQGLEKSKAIPFSMVRDWHTQPHLINALSNRVRTGLQQSENPSNAAVLFTAHSLPKRFVSANDPYESQLRETSRLVAVQGGAKDWDFAFQSAGEPSASWLGPMIKEKITELRERGLRELLVCPIGFVSDHLEILFDLDIEAREYGLSLGMRVSRTSSLNDDPEFIEAIAETVRPLLPRPTGESIGVLSSLP
ncbi:ferrochelatase [Candidatus Bathyarchaeota archaeon]|nr:ferrochelatase [Candidatus Bathyarchaeota archaeon]